MPARMAVGVGVLLAIVIDRLTEYFTGHNTASPVNDAKKAADTGPANFDPQWYPQGFNRPSGLCCASR
ncbi:hypothetical protein [Candidatus Villigracilis saccharophilus]|uniref:hypothetical protein n=1 Tax=Candidatus Villigracilis saccharophilus TaxID=3140684 RepID=UPI00313527B0|nr:hypothetical protein [Anaerolineales bacterium]